MKRFFSAASAGKADHGHQVFLDDKAVRTPAGSLLALPTSALADAIAQEWEACGDVIKPADLPLTQLANSALDRTAPNPAAVQEAICAYVDTDLLCYRAEAPDTLVAAQSKHWDPPLKWLGDTHGVFLTPTTQLMGHRQPEQAAAKVGVLVADVEPFALTALHQLTVLTGSAVLALAFAGGFAGAQPIWDAATVDERYQAERWGEDAEAADALEKKRADYLAAATFWTSLRPDI